MEVDRTQLANVWYLDTASLGERQLWLQPFFDGVRWHQWSPTDGGGLVEIQPVDFTMGPYFATLPACPEKDGQFLFLGFIIKHASFEDVTPFANGIQNDLHNLGAALWALDHFFDLKAPFATGSERLALTQLEYILVLCRSLLDLLQATIVRLWKRVAITNTSIKPRQLPESFADVALRGSSPRTSEEIGTKYGLPTPLAQFYTRHAAFFANLRGARDEVVHTGTRDLVVERGPKGFTVAATKVPFSVLAPWNVADLAHGVMGSLNFLVAHTIRETLRVAEEFAVLMPRLLLLPSDIAPGKNVFLRGYHTEQLRRLEVVCADPWARFIPT